MTELVGARSTDLTSKEQRDAIDVHLHDGLLTLNANGVPLDAVVRAIGERAGFATITEGVVDSPVRRSFTDIPLETALRYLLDAVPNVMFYAPSEDGEENGRLLEVRLYEWVKSPPPTLSTVTEHDTLAKLFDGSRNARLTEIRKLRRAGDPEAVLPLGRVLKEDADPGVRSHAAGALGEIGLVAAIPALHAALEDTEQSVRIRAIRALGQINSDQATQILGDLLLNSPQQRSRLMAGWALGHQGGLLAQSYLEAALEDGDDLVRRGAERALAQIQASAKRRDAAQAREGRE